MSIESKRQTRDKTKWEFTLSGVDVSIANGLRRMLLSEVETLAIHIVEFEENSSVLNEDMIAHRLGLIPLRCNTINDMLLVDDCGCDYNCDYCGCIIELDVKNETHSDMRVTTKDLVIKNETHTIEVVKEKFKIKKKDGSIETKEPDILIIMLAPKQHMKVKCLARKGNHSGNAKFGSVCTATYTYEEDTDVEPVASITKPFDGWKLKNIKKAINELEKEGVEVVFFAVQSKLIELWKNLDSKTKNTLYSKFEKDKQRYLEEKVDYDNTIERIRKTFYFVVETDGCLTAKQAVLGALCKLQSKILKFGNELEFVR